MNLRPGHIVYCADFDNPSKKRPAVVLRVRHDMVAVIVIKGTRQYHSDGGRADARELIATASKPGQLKYMGLSDVTYFFRSDLEVRAFADIESREGKPNVCHPDVFDEILEAIESGVLVVPYPPPRVEVDDDSDSVPLS